MNRTVLWSVVSTLLAGLLLAGCGSRAEKQSATGTAATQTVAPAAAQPDRSTGTDAMTQTVDVEDSRSEEDGGTITAQQTAKVPTSSTAAAPAASEKHAKSKKKH